MPWGRKRRKGTKREGKRKKRGGGDEQRRTKRSRPFLRAAFGPGLYRSAVFFLIMGKQDMGMAMGISVLPTPVPGIVFAGGFGRENPVGSGSRICVSIQILGSMIDQIIITSEFRELAFVRKCLVDFSLYLSVEMVIACLVA
jgi:hypothetical protein